MDTFTMLILLGALILAVGVFYIKNDRPVLRGFLIGAGFLFIVLAGITPAKAEVITIDTSKITVDQYNTIKSIGNSAKDAFNTVTTEKVSSYAQVGKDIGLGIAEAARQIGLAAVDFAKSPIGMFAFAIIAYKLVVVGMFKSIALFSLAVLWLWVVFKHFRRTVGTDDSDNKMEVNDKWFGVCVVHAVATVPAYFFLYHSL